MQTKILLLALSAVAFSSCSTAYKSGQTPDDVYYSPVRYTEAKQDNDRDEVKNKPAQPATDYSINMSIRDRRWRDFSDDYNYDNSPYNYTCNKYNYGYYYNPYYYPWAIYTGKTSYSKPVNSTPRMVNLNAYKNYNSNVATSKTTGSTSWFKPSDRYNNSNSDNNGRRNRVTIFPNNNSSSNNNTRTYSPSSSSGSSSGSSSPGSSSSGSSVSRPGRGG
jgi:hypothetical protein